MIFNKKALPAFIAVLGAMLLIACSAPSNIKDSSISRIAFGSCAGDWVEQPIWKAIAGENPELYISLGDAIYADWDGEKLVEVTPASLKEKWNGLARRPEFAKLKKTVPMIATWDNHDYGSHDLGADFEFKEDSKAIFLEFWDEPRNSMRYRTPGIYADYFYGREGRRIHIILLDTKSFRTKTELLGVQQWQWLEEQLVQPADLRLIVSSTQIIPNEKGMDEWGNYPRERQALFDLSETEAFGTVVLLSGNVHFAEISEKHGLTELTSSGLTKANINSVYAAAENSYRIAGPVIQPNFGTLEIDWEKSKLLMSIISESGTVQLQHKIDIK